MRPSRTRASGRGFTLIELMAVIAIVGLLAALAVPAWQDSLRKSRRAGGKALLQEIAAQQERYFTVNNTYADTFAKLGYPSTPVSADKAYTASLASPGGWVAGATVTATLNSGFTDPRCGNLTLTTTGVRGTSVSPGTGCW